MTEDEILKEIEINKNINNNGHLKEPNKYSEAYLFNYSSTYEAGLSFYVKNNSQNQYVSNKDEKYTILFIRGRIDYIEDFDSCITKRDEIVEILSGLFPNVQKIEKNWTYELDPSGNSIMDDVVFAFDSKDKVKLRCSNWDENYRIKRNWSEGLNVVMQTKEIDEWMGDYK
tara:strand:- start:82 stop:594 length:513 start_codon:yes stop_codon:yes gene_type:complete